jgi:hypothetical protein
VKAPWRETMVVNLSRDAVELQFLDMPRAPYVSTTFFEDLQPARGKPASAAQSMRSGRAAG